jgi:hypothetical protein
MEEGINQPNETDRIESLRLILEQEQRRSVSYEEALDVGETLISFFEVLADDTRTVALATVGID